MSVGIGLIELLLLVAIAAGVFVVASLARSRKGTAKVSGPVCGACGYNTTGLTSLTCPECGRDLREAGIITRSTPVAGMTFPAAATLFSVLWLFAALLLINELAWVLTVLTSSVVHVRQTVLIGPRSGRYAAVQVNKFARASGGGPSAASIELRLQMTGTEPPAAPLKVEPADESLGPDAVLQWLAAGGVDTSDERVKVEANRIAAAAHRAARTGGLGASPYGGWSSSSSGTDPHFGTVTNSSTQSTSRFSGFGIGLFMLCFATWAAGIRYLWLMRRSSPA